MMDAAGSINTEPYVDAIENEEDIIDDSEERGLVSGDSCSTKILETSIEPHDRYSIVYLLFYLFGVTSLVPWNFLVTANDYWMYKFRDVNPPHNLTREAPKTPFQAEFTSYLNVAMAVPNLLFLILNSLYGHLVSVKCRMQGSMIVITLAFIVTTALVPVDSDSWQNGFFIITMVTVVIMTAASAIFISGIIGIASRFSKQYMTAVVGGQSLGGILAALAQIGSLAFNLSPTHSALIYFVVADAMVVASLAAYVWLHRIDFYTHHVLRACDTPPANRHRHVSMVALSKKIWVYCFSIFAVFGVSMSVWPAVTVLVESHPVTKGTDWNLIYFVPVVNYLIFNCGDYAGRLVSGYLLWPRSPWPVAGASVLRAALVPLLMLCNAQPRTHLPVWFLWDWEYIIIIVLFAVTNGYLTNIIMINSTRAVEVAERERASALVATLLSVGLAAGAAASLLLVRLL